MNADRETMRFYALAYRTALANRRLLDALRHLLTACLWRAQSEQTAFLRADPPPFPNYELSSFDGTSGQQATFDPQRPCPKVWPRLANRR
jgi:hypothetical protein